VNADSDNVKELVVIASSQQKDAQATGTAYIIKAYDNLQRPPLPGRLKRIEDISGKLAGFEGTKNGAASKAKYRSEKDVRDGLEKMGYK